MSSTLIDRFREGFGSIHALGKRLAEAVDVPGVLTFLGKEFERFWDLLVQWGSKLTNWVVIQIIAGANYIKASVEAFAKYVKGKVVFVKETFISGAKLALKLLSFLAKPIVSVGKAIASVGAQAFRVVQKIAFDLCSALNIFARSLGVAAQWVVMVAGGVTLNAIIMIVVASHRIKEWGKARLGTSNEKLDACKKQLDEFGVQLDACKEQLDEYGVQLDACKEQLDAYTKSLLCFLENMNEAGRKELKNLTTKAEKHLREAINKLPPLVPEDKTKYRLIVMGHQRVGKSTICNATLRYPKDRRIPTTETETKTPCPITLAGSLRLDPGCHVELSECTLDESIGTLDLLLARALHSFHGVIVVNRGHNKNLKDLIRNIRMWKKDLIVVQSYLDNEELDDEELDDEELDEEEQLNKKAEEMVARTKEIIRKIDPSWEDPGVFAVSGREEYLKRCGKGSGNGYQFNAMESLMFDMARRKTAEWQENAAT